MSEEEDRRLFEQWWRHGGERERLVEQEALRQFHECRDAVDARMLVTYHCKSRGDLLLAVWSSIVDLHYEREHLLFRRAAYTIPRPVNMIESSASGRRKNSTDGQNHWPEWGGDLVDMDADLAVNVRCQHAVIHPTVELLRADAQRATATRRARHRV